MPTNFCNSPQKRFSSLLNTCFRKNTLCTQVCSKTCHVNRGLTAEFRIFHLNAFEFGCECERGFKYLLAVISLK